MEKVNNNVYISDLSMIPVKTFLKVKLYNQNVFVMNVIFNFTSLIYSMTLVNRYNLYSKDPVSKDAKINLLSLSFLINNDNNK